MGSGTSRLIAPVMFQPPRPATYTYATMGAPPLYEVDHVPCLFFRTVHQPRGVVLYLHCSAVDLGMICRVTQRLARNTGCAVLAPEYPGYGTLHAQTPSAEGAVANAMRVYAYAVRTFDLPILVVGRSIGSGVAGQLCRRLYCSPDSQHLRRPAALVLLSPFQSMASMAAGLGQDMSDGLVYLYNTEEAVQHITCPTVVMHGDRDEFIPPSQGDAVVRASAAPIKRFVLLPNSTHARLDWQRIETEVATLARC